MREFIEQGEAPMSGRPAGTPVEKEVQRADSLNTHLFRRIRHSRAPRDGGDQSEGRRPWWEA
jgi:hypothetical protein